MTKKFFFTALLAAMAFANAHANAVRIDQYLEPHPGNPVNNYSGLNFLRKRLSEQRKTDTESPQTSPIPTTPDSIRFDDGDCLGAPIFFFFKLGKSDLRDNSQLVNLDEIARIAIKQNLKVDIVGAADRRTGTTKINDKLAIARSRYIAEYLSARGVPTENITFHSSGGISTFSPTSANRHATVRLSTP
jgi:outer membrane protein OmpA-like peptidoglycan-associated protein